AEAKAASPSITASFQHTGEREAVRSGVPCKGEASLFSAEVGLPCAELAQEYANVRMRESVFAVDWIT
ncbi:unnamed protein product, partial [Hydatigera taeniaeformis]|uniref:DUF1338 domain-containing protein n=1 Tax=Hydatigena taeniaeformis TaxID=6205 RepID=A0A0R3X3I4_HYDTA